MVSSPSRLLLGRVITGKILFLVVSFFVLIIVTVLQSQLTTLLSKSLRYPNIDTLEELSNSNLFIQTPDLETSLGRLQDYDFYDSLKNRLTEGHTYYSSILIEEANDGLVLNYPDLWKIVNDGRSSLDTSSNVTPWLKSAFEVRSNLQSILRSDAFELTVSNLHQRSRANFLATDFMTANFQEEFHLVKECILTYPQTFIIQRNPYLPELYLKFISTYVEAGFIEHLAGLSYPFISPDDSALNVGIDSSAEAFTMQHLQPAFIALGLGWLCSSIVFVAELVVDILKGTRFSKFAGCIERYIRPASLGA